MLRCRLSANESKRQPSCAEKRLTSSIVAVAAEISPFATVFSKNMFGHCLELAHIDHGVDWWQVISASLYRVFRFARVHDIDWSSVAQATDTLRVFE